MRPAAWLTAPLLTLMSLVALSVAACTTPSTPTPPPRDVQLRLGFDPSTVNPENTGKLGEPGLPAGFSWRPVVPAGAYDDPDVIALDPSEQFLYFVTHLQYPDGSVYRVELATGNVKRLTTKLQRPGGIEYYRPGNVLIVAEEGTGLGPLERQQGFLRAVLPDMVDQETPPPLRAMGQFRGEGIEPVGANVIYLTEDQPHGGYVYKYELESPPDLAQGTLYTFKENEGWIKTAYLEAPNTGKEGTKFFAAEAIQMGPDGKLYMVISAEVENRVVAIDPVTAKVTDFVTAKTKGFSRPDQLAFAPNGVLFITGEGNVWAALPDGPDADTLSDGVFKFLTGLDVVQGIAFTRDGSTFYASARGRVDAIIAISGFNFR